MNVVVFVYTGEIGMNLLILLYICIRWIYIGVPFSFVLSDWSSRLSYRYLFIETKRDIGKENEKSASRWRDGGHDRIRSNLPFPLRYKQQHKAQGQNKRNHRAGSRRTIEFESWLRSHTSAVHLIEPRGKNFSVPFQAPEGPLILLTLLPRSG